MTVGTPFPMQEVLGAATVKRVSQQQARKQVLLPLFLSINWMFSIPDLISHNYE